MTAQFSNDAGWAAEFGLIRSATAGDVPRIAQFDADTFGDDSWPTTVWEAELRAMDRTYLLLESAAGPHQSIGRVLGVGGISHGPEAELMTIGVHEELRARGIASRMLENLLSIAVRHDADAVFLEVRAQGVAAQSLYRKFGFIEVGRRQNYYRDDDAIVMKLDLCD